MPAKKAPAAKKPARAAAKKASKPSMSKAPKPVKAPVVRGGAKTERTSAKGPVKAASAPVEGKNLPDVASPRVPFWASAAPVSSGPVKAVARAEVYGRPLLCLSWSFLWRLWLLAFLWGFLANGALWPLAVSQMGGMLSLPVWMALILVVDRIVIGLLHWPVLLWLLGHKRLVGGQQLVLENGGKPRARATLGLWFSLLWRVVALAAAGFLLIQGIVMLLNSLMPGYGPFVWVEELINSGTFAPGTNMVGVVVDCLLLLANLLYFKLVVPYLAWGELLKKRTFSWGVLELRRLKG